MKILINEEQFEEKYKKTFKQIHTISNEDARDELLDTINQTKGLYYESRRNAEEYLSGVDVNVEKVFKNTEYLVIDFHKRVNHREI